MSLHCKLDYLFVFPCHRHQMGWTPRIAGRAERPAAHTVSITTSGIGGKFDLYSLYWLLKVYPWWTLNKIAHCAVEPLRQNQINLAYLKEPTKLQLARAHDKRSAPSNAINELVSTLPEPCRQETRHRAPGHLQLQGSQSLPKGVI